MRSETHSDAQLYDMWCDGKTAHQIAKEIGSSSKAVNGQLQRHSRLLKEQNFRAVAEAYEPGEADTSDNEKWLETKLRLMAMTRHIKVLIESDHHYIDHDPQAIAVKNKIAKYFQPDLVSLNGDTLDFGAVGHFLLSRSENRKDALKTVAPAYTTDIDALDEATNGAPKIHNSGNHNARLDTYLDLHLEFAQTIEEYYRHVVRAGGRVMMFDFAEELLIGHLMIQHGQRVGDYAAKNALLDLGMGVSHAQGHGHVANTTGKSGRRGLSWHTSTPKTVTCISKMWFSTNLTTAA
jgi:hypothetical protein